MEELNTPMNASTASWLSDLEMEDYDFFSKDCHLNLLDANDEEFLSHDIASALQGNTLQPSLSSECTSKTLSNSSTDETTFVLERPEKLLKTSSTNSNSSSITENFSPKLSPSSSMSSFHSQILSFDNPNSSPANTTQFYCFDCTLNPKQNEVVPVSLPQLGNTHFSGQNPKGSSKNKNLEAKTSQGKRTPGHAQDHIMAERKRREKLSQSFIALAALVPGLKKMDKASVLGDAIKYVKDLKERVVVLEEENKKTRVESVVVMKKPEHCSDDDSSSCDEIIETEGANEPLIHVEARVSGQEVLLRIHCQKHKGLLVKILAEIQSLNLFVVNSSVLPFGDFVLDITIVAKMGDGYNLTIKELVKNLRVATLKFLS